jgi:hypothetical protein
MYCVGYFQGKIAVVICIVKTAVYSSVRLTVTALGLSRRTIAIHLRRLGTDFWPVFVRYYHSTVHMPVRYGILYLAPYPLYRLYRNRRKTRRQGGRFFRYFSTNAVFLSGLA